MNYNLLNAILCGIASFLCFKMHKLWLKSRIENEDSKPFTYADSFANWLIIIGFAIAAIVNLYIAIE
jgi:hypothetical protein